MVILIHSFILFPRPLALPGLHIGKLTRRLDALPVSLQRR